MIYCIVGANAYAADEARKKIQQALPDCLPETCDTATLTVNGLADIVRGGSLFSVKRLVVLHQLSENKQVWDALGDWASTVGQDITLVLMEEKVDKRTKTYKALARVARIIPVEPWIEYDINKAQQWLKSYAKEHGVELLDGQCRDMIIRSFTVDGSSNKRTINQLQLAQAVTTLQACDTITDEVIATILPPAVADTVFDLLDVAVKKDEVRLTKLLAELEGGDDPYAVFAVVMGQWAQLVAVVLAPKASASDIGIHPYVAKKMRELAPFVTHKEIATLTSMATTMDALAKRMAFSPWDSLGYFLYAVAMR